MFFSYLFLSIFSFADINKKRYIVQTKRLPTKLKSKSIINKTLGRARDPHANGAWVNKTNSMKHEVFVLAGQRIDQKRKMGWKRG